MNTTFLLGAWPYIALASLLVGTLARYSLLLRRRDAAGSSLVPGAKGLGLERGVWCLLLAAHLVGFAFPAFIRAWDAASWRLYLLEAFGFILGLSALASWARRTVEGLRRSDLPVAREVVDTMFLALVFVSLLSGLLTAAMYRWSSAWSAATIAPYVTSLPSRGARVDYVLRMPFLIQLHVFASFASLAVFPLSSLALHVIRAVERLLGRPVVLVAQLATRRFAARPKGVDPKGDTEAS